MKKTKLLYIGIAVVFAAIGMALANRHTTPAPAAISASSHFYSLSLNDASGQPQAMAKWKNRPVVVNFWATWCAPCVEEMPELVALQEELKPRQIQILGIGIDSPSNIAQFAEKYKITYPLYVGGLEGSELARQLGNQAGGLPFTVLIGKDGAIKKAYLGRLKMDELRRDLMNL